MITLIFVLRHSIENRSIEHASNNEEHNCRILEYLQMLLIITDGASNGGINSLRPPVSDLRAMSVNIFSIGVGSSLIQEELEFMASEPKDSHLFFVSNMEELPNLLHTLTNSSCQGKG